MSKSNKFRKVNKADGSKKRSKKAMRKSRRADSKNISDQQILENKNYDLVYSEIDMLK